MNLQEQISAIGMTEGTEPASPAPANLENPPAPTAAPAGEPAAQATPNPEPSAPGTPDPLQEVELLKRVIATDPAMRDRYVAEKLGIPQAYPQYQQPQVQAPAYQQQPQAQQPQQPELPWNDENPYDPTDATHQMAMMGYMLQQNLAPFAQFVQQQQQENQQFQQQQQQARISELENQTRNAMEQHLPGFTQMAAALDSRTATPDQEMLLNFAYNKFTEEMHRSYNPAHWHQPRVQQEVIRSIAPTIKSLADKLGILTPSATPNPQAAPPKPGMYVEPSTPVPQATKSDFDAAYQRKDITGMISAIGRTQ